MKKNINIHRLNYVFKFDNSYKMIMNNIILITLVFKLMNLSIVFIRQYQFNYNELQILSFHITDISRIYLLEIFYQTLNYLLNVF